jgi:hypothetical protein
MRAHGAFEAVQQEKNGSPFRRIEVVKRDEIPIGRLEALGSCIL